jgi:hypothetical protein
VKENKKLPKRAEEHGVFFVKLKQIANGKPGTYTPLSTEEIDTLEKGLKTKEWASLTDNIFQKKIKEFLDPEIEEVDYNAAPKAVPNAEQAPAPAAEPKAAPSRYATASLTSIKSFIENGDAEGKKKLSALQSLKSGTRKTGVLYPDVEEYLAGIDVEWWKKKPEELRGVTPEATKPKATKPKATKPKAAKPKAAEPKATEPKATEPKGTTPLDIIFDYDDAISSGEELAPQLDFSCHTIKTFLKLRTKTAMLFLMIVFMTSNFSRNILNYTKSIPLK